MIQYLYSPEGWNLERPQLILSVTGGAQKFTIPHRMKKAFKRGLIKAAASTGAWIITGGTNTGVMRLGYFFFKIFVSFLVFLFHAKSF